MNRRIPILLSSLLILLPGLAAAQVYKCKGKSGESLYSEHPCDANAQPMKLREDTPAASSPPAATDGSDSMPAADEANEAATATDGGDRDAERQCIANATASIYGPSNDRVAAYQQQMAMLGEQLAKTGDAQRKQELQARMTRLRQAISNEHAHAHDLANDTRKRCIAQFRPTP